MKPAANQPIVIVSAGDFSEWEAKRIRMMRQKPYLVACDGGLASLLRFSLTPDFVIGDFDSAQAETVEKFRRSAEAKDIPFEVLNVEKDETDTEAALTRVLSCPGGDITILGGLGSRFDHGLANVHCLLAAAKRGRRAVLENEHNRIYVKIEPFVLYKRELFGHYVSLFPLTSKVEGLSLRGFKYPLEGATLSVGCSLGVSNELIEEEGQISFIKGELIVIESRD